MSKKAKWYVVWKGRTPGIYTTWAECEAQVKGFSGAQYKSFEKQREAQRAWHSAWYVVWHGRTPGLYQGWANCQTQIADLEDAEYKMFADEEAALAAYQAHPSTPPATDPDTPKPVVRIAQPTAAPASDDDEDTPDLRSSQPIRHSICVDAACRGVPGPVEYQAVYTDTGEYLFRQGPFAWGTNNIGEFLAVVHALASLQRKGDTRPIYSDSLTALSWVRAKQCKTTLPEDERNEELFVLIRRAEQWLHENAYENAVLKWDTEHWGEIPADFGRK